MVKVRAKRSVAASSRAKVKVSRKIQPVYDKNERSTECVVKQIQLRRQSLPIKKCVVKIKRLRLQTKIGSSSATKNADAKSNTFHKVNKQISHKNNANITVPSDMDKINTEHQPDARAMETECVTDDALNISTFSPERNSTMLQPMRRCRVSKMLENANESTSLKPPQRSKETNLTEINKIEMPCRVRIPRIPIMKLAPTAVQMTSELEKPTEAAKSRFFHRDQPMPRASVCTRNVYEFLSQSQIRDSDANRRVDPAADIIKKLVDDGKASLFMRSKKTGKMRAKALKRKIRPIGKRKQCSLQKLAENKQPADNEDKQSADQHNKEIPLENQHNIEIPQENQHKQIQYPLSPIYEPEEDLSIVEPIEQVPLQARHRKSHTPSKGSVGEGAFSHLARSVLVNQAKTHNISARRELLDIARKYVSTPINRKHARATTATALHTTAISPIALPPGNKRHTAGETSPWRVSEDVPLPSTFVFGFNTSNLPSYSSDYIRRRHVYVPDEVAPQQSSHTLTEQSHMPELNTTPILSDTPNDSNGENISPAINKETFQASNSNRLENMPSGQENDSVESFQHMPNPRRALQHRSPLKDINILDVVILPSWKKAAAKSPLKTARPETTVLGQHVSTVNELPKTPQRNMLDFPEQASPARTIPSASKEAAANLFGFEEFLNDENNLNRSNVNMPINEKLELYEKLQRLRGMRPNDSELPQVSKVGMRYAYDDVAARKPKQLKLQDMLCSTMIDAEKAPTIEVENRRSSLFQEIDPEVTFDKQKPRRTYVREQPKRKRKQRVHVLFIDSESSEEDNDEQDSPEKRKENVPQQPQKRACSRKDAEHQAKLRQYITSFNKECEEVEKFQLTIE